MTSTQKEIAGLVTLLTSSFVAALGIVAYMVYFWGPSGDHTLKNVLLAPEMLSQLSYQEIDPLTGSGPRMVFDHLEYTFRGEGGGQLVEKKVSKEAYQEFYDLIRNERSHSPTPAETEQFQGGGISSLRVMVREEQMGKKGSARTFQEVHFTSSGDHYRVEVRWDSKTRDWAYFEHKGIGPVAYNLFGKNR